MKILCISDTHTHIPKRLPDGIDFVIHSGDATSKGYTFEYENFFKQWGRLLERHEIPKMLFVPGNHDFDPQSMWIFHLSSGMSDLIDIVEYGDYEYKGLKIFCSRFVSEFGNWEGEMEYYERKKMWSRIPEKIDILVTHTPPFGVLDYVNNYRKEYCGCPILRNRIINCDIKFSVFGHIHEGSGHIQQDNCLYVNCSYLNEKYIPNNNLFIIDTEDKSVNIINERGI